VLYLAVLDGSAHDFKPSARRFLSRADALVTIGPRFDPNAWREIDANVFAGRPVFPVSKTYSSPELAHFVRTRLGFVAGREVAAAS
jgi:hypothetical protein